MKEINKNNVWYKLKSSSFAIIVLMLAVSCFKTKDDTNYRNIIPENTFIAILKELHLSNSLLTLPDVRQRIEGDSTMIYIEIIESHGYSKEAMDTTLQYYFIRNPKKLIRIYDRIMGDFTELQSHLQSEMERPELSLPDRWEGAKFLIFPGGEESGNNDFEIVLPSGGFYSLRFTATVFPGDETFNPCFSAIMSYSNRRANITHRKIPLLRYLKDGHPHDYRIEGTVPAAGSIISGRFYDYSSDPAFGNSHAVIENISFFYSPE